MLCRGGTPYRSRTNCRSQNCQHKCVRRKSPGTIATARSCTCRRWRIVSCCTERWVPDSINRTIRKLLCVVVASISSFAVVRGQPGFRDLCWGAEATDEDNALYGSTGWCAAPSSAGDHLAATYTGIKVVLHSRMHRMGALGYEKRWHAYYAWAWPSILNGYAARLSPKMRQTVSPI
jgi:hypothetical protein